MNTASVFVNIDNNTEVEPNKEFFLDLEIPAAAAAMGVTKGSPDSATVTIIDENGECCSNVMCSIAYNQCILSLHKFLAKLASCTIFGPIV